MKEFTLKNFPDGRVLLKKDKHHMWVNTPPRVNTFYGDDINDMIEEYCFWLKMSINRMDWLDDSIEEEEGIIIDLS